MNARGMCPSCGNQQRLRADGTLGAHGCTGAGKPPRPPGSPRPLKWHRSLPLCEDCQSWLSGMNGAMLAGAAASVAIEAGGSPGAMLRNLIAGYHDNGHREAW